MRDTASTNNNSSQGTMNATHNDAEDRIETRLNYRGEH